MQGQTLYLQATAMQRWLGVYAHLLFLFIGISSHCNAQSGKGIEYGSAFHLGLGPSLQHSFNFGLTYEWVRPAGTVALRFGAVKAERQMRRTRKPKERNLDFSVLYGWKHAFRLDQYNEVLTVSFASGLSVARFIRRTDELLSEPDFNCIFCSWRYASDNENVGAIALEMRIVFRKLDDDFGIGLGLWGNLNSRQSFGGVLFSIYLGS